MSLRTLVAVAFVVQALVPQPAAAQEARAPDVDIVAVRSTADQEVSLVAVPPGPLDPSAVTVNAGGTDLPVRVEPVMSGRTATALVVDASAGGARSLERGGLSGAAGFLLQLPPDSYTGVIADRAPPAVAAEPSIGVSDDLQAVSALQSSGARATADALSLALRELPPSPGRQPVIVLYTGAADAGDESAAVLVERLRQARAILAVVTTSSDSGYWSRVATASGGLVVAAEPQDALRALDQVADGLRARYVVTFPRPAGAPVEANVRFDVAGKPLLVAVGLPPEPARAGRSVPSSPSTGERNRLWLWAAVAGVSAVAVAIVITRRSRRGRTGPLATAPAGPDRRPAPLAGDRVDNASQTTPAGVRFFDVAHPGGPREITGSPVEKEPPGAGTESARAAESPPRSIRLDQAGDSVDARPAQRHGANDPDQ